MHELFQILKNKREKKSREYTSLKNTQKLFFFPSLNGYC